MISELNKDDHHAGFASDVLPEVSNLNQEKDSNTGVSTNCVWHVLRATYGREEAANAYLISKGIKTFYPTTLSKKEINGKVTKMKVSALPNLLFAYSTFEALKEHVYDNIHYETKYLRFYYNRHHDGNKEPLIVPESQMQSLMIICADKEDDIIIHPTEVEKFKKGQRVVIHEGRFKGVEGIVARYSGQQRVGIVIDGLLTAVTAYVPTAFLRKLEDEEIKISGK